MAVIGFEWIIVAVIIIALLLWGPKKLPELARSVGLARKEFEKAQREAEAFVKPIGTGTTSAEDALLKTAKELGITTEGKTKDEISQEIVERAKETKEQKK